MHSYPVPKPPRVLAWICVLSLVGFSTVAGQELLDPFEDGELDTTRWTVSRWGFGPSVAESGQDVQVEIPFDSSDDPAEGFFWAGYDSICQLEGDYDIQVDFELHTWPFASGVRVGIGAQGATERVSLGSSADFPGQPRESYVNDFGDGVFDFIPTGDLSGTLRLVRSGNQATGYYRSSDEWVALRTSTISTDNTKFWFAAWSHDYAFTGSGVMVSFDNFTINSGRLIGSTGQCWDDDADGFRPPEDCDDSDPAVNPDAVELPGNFIDEDCNGDLGDCDPCFDWRNHGEYIRCTSKAAEALVNSGDITQEKADQLVTDAARSDIGKKGYIPPECP